NCLLDSALEPVIARALKEPDPEKALLDLKVVDPACGSGHFLISASHRIGKHLAMIRTGEIEPPPEQRRKALRDVVSRCIYGVDVNPLAVELCKVALWIETLDPGRPLGFLDHHIKCGNSLIGATPELLEKGIPDDAFKPVEGDDKKIAAAIRKKNKEERKGQQDLFAEVAPESEWQEAVEDFQEWGSMPEHSFHEVCDKAAQYETLQDRPAYRHEKEVADLWTAAFFWPLTEETGTTVPTEDIFRRFQGGDYELKDEARKRMESIATKHRFFHWHLEFPEVFTNISLKRFPPLAGGSEGGGSKGFDCVLGNPPWERLKLEEKEWFSSRNPEIANAPKAATRRKMIESLKNSDPHAYSAYKEALRNSELARLFVRSSGRYPLCGRGDVNTYAIFAETKRFVMGKTGRIGCIVPSGIATDLTTRLFFRDVMDGGFLVSLFDFENRKGIFPDVQGNIKFCLLTISSEKRERFLFCAQLDALSLVGDSTRRYFLTSNDIKRINPNTLNFPTFFSARDAEINKVIYDSMPVIVMEDETKESNPWKATFLAMFHLTNDSQLFRLKDELEYEGWLLEGNIFRLDGEVYLPLYEAKLAHQFNHRASTFEGTERSARYRTHAGTKGSTISDLLDSSFSPIPRYWVPKDKVRERASDARWFLAFRDVISAVADSRSLIATFLPPYGVGNTLPILLTEKGGPMACCLLAALNSFVLDYVLRQKASGGHLNFYVFKQLPIPSPESFGAICPWESDSKIVKWVFPRVLELSFTAWDLKTLAEECGYEGPPYRWDDARRFMLRCELDAAYFHLYCIIREDMEYIMDTFTIVRRRDEQKYGEYRTKRVILECYDTMAEAMKTGRPYQTILDPPPADLGV
ncbi:MAG: N-6 DNA methylase, partial [Deltaproteobacteria bacterium]|nr:N-6 DNA methylase [Deltaproteobacteria bacterium]